jgi:hypothetical protein
MTHDLTRFSMTDMISCSSALRKLAAGADSMEEVARRIVRYLYDNLVVAESGQRACALVRFYKTHNLGELEADLYRFARSMLKEQPESPAMKCLTLLATAGDKPEWNSRKESGGHKVIPLPSKTMIEQSPMISQLIKQFGLESNLLLQPDPNILVDADQKTFNVFHVPEAEGSKYIPAQEDFVIPFGIKSVLGFGGLLPSGDLFAIIMFSKVHIPRATADMFKTFALSAKVSVLPFVGGRVFA